MFFIMAFPLLASAQSAWDVNIWQGAKCGSSAAITTSGPTGPCDFCDMVIVANNVITYGVQLAVLVVVAVIVYGGILMMTSAGNDNKFGEGKSKMTAAIVGLIVVLCAWVIVNTVLHLLTGNVGFVWNQIQCY